jgi:cytoskeletal protein CcmA (bactofilin family)
VALFGKKNGDVPRKRKPGGVDTLVGSNTEIRGDVLFSGGLHVDGRIKGKVLSMPGDLATLSVSETGSIEGDVSVPMITVNGEVSGNIYAGDKMTLAPDARVTGNVYYNRLEVQAGAEVNGQLVHDPGGERAPASMHEPRGETAVVAGELRDVRDLRRPKVVS